MMTIDDIKRLIANDEHRTLEVKKSTGELKDGMHAACAMLNTEGGWLIFGVTPQSLKILGQEVTDATHTRAAQVVPLQSNHRQCVTPDHIPRKLGNRHSSHS